MALEINTILDWETEELEDRKEISSRTIPFGVSFLDDFLVGLMPTDLVLVGAKTGRGKTAFLTQLAYNQAAAGRKTLFFALEASKWEIHRRILYRKMSEIFFKNYAATLGPKYRLPRFREWLTGVGFEDLLSIENEARAAIRHHISNLEIVYTDERYSMEIFEEDCKIRSETHDVILIDHLHYFFFSGNEFDGLKRAIGQIRNLSLKLRKPVILAAQMRKGNSVSKSGMPDTEDFHGHSDIPKISTTAIILSPAPKEYAPKNQFPTWVHICKSREAAETTSFVGMTSFDVTTSNYSEQYMVADHSPFEAPKLIGKKEDLPVWAKNAIPAPPHLTGEPLVENCKDKWFGNYQRNYTKGDE